MGIPGDLYQNAVLDHYKNPKNYRNLHQANRQADEINPLCGDHIFVYLVMENGVIKDISFQGEGCALATASASMMTCLLKGKTEEQAKDLSDCFHRILTLPIDSCIDSGILGDLIVFSSLREYPVRAKCVTLPWKALRTALEKI